MHVTGGIGRAGTQCVPSEFVKVPNERPVLPFIWACRRLQLGGVPVTLAGEAHVNARNRAASGPSLSAHHLVMCRAPGSIYD